MDGRILADSIINTTPESIRYLYASYTDLSIWKMMYSSIHDIIKSDGVKTYHKSIQKAAESLDNVSVNDLKIRLLLDLCKFLKIKPNSLKTRHDYYELCDDVVRRCIGINKETRQPGINYR
jgi:hypothetical protein